MSTLSFRNTKNFTFYRQLNAMDCGPSCLRMIAKYYGKYYNADTLRQLAGFSKQGVSMLGISESAEKIGFRTIGIMASFDQLSEIKLPCILHWDKHHFVILLSLKGTRKEKVAKIADPAKGIISYRQEEFLSYWRSSKSEDGNLVGSALLLEPSPKFYEQPGEKEKRLSWKLMFQYLKQSKWQIFQVFIALLITSCLQLIFPFLTQSIVDTGITTQNVQFIVIVLMAQLMLTFSRAIVDFIRGRLLLRISNVLNLSVLSDFWIKLTSLPLSYFDQRHTGDTLQRIGDHKQIQNFLTGPALNTLFSVVNFVIYAVVLIVYNVQLFFIFCAGSILYFFWIQLFLGVRRKLNYQSFHLAAKENNATLQLVQGMQEVRLNNAEQLKRWNWENIQVMLLKLNFKNLTYGQWQQAGALLINQSKDLVISFLVAKMVIDGQLTLGAMLAVQYIIGQLSSPVEQWVGFVQNAQDAKISMERLNEVHQLEDEETIDKTYVSRLPDNKSIFIEKLSFSYPGAGNYPVLDNISLNIPEGKVIAIVGASGSGKTTLLKLLLKFYEQYSGEIKIGEGNFRYVSPSFWRSQCGAVLQDGYIFNDNVARNIVVGEEVIDYDRLIRSCRVANILSFIESLPNGFYTQLGADGIGVSQGQRQRLLIARAVYKDPPYLFFDEATNSLDANNERTIIGNLATFFKERTVVVVAHRLSTVKNADKIVVIHNGKIVEEGTHEDLSGLKGHYFELVKNQLELGA